MATFVVPRCVLHAGSLRRLGLSEDCTSSGRPDFPGTRVRASSGNGGNSSADDEQVERAKRALESLDQQLNTLSQSNGRAPRTPQPLRTLPGPEKKKKKVARSSGHSSMTASFSTLPDFCSCSPL